MKYWNCKYFLQKSMNERHNSIDKFLGSVAQKLMQQACIPECETTYTGSSADTNRKTVSVVDTVIWLAEKQLPKCQFYIKLKTKNCSIFKE